MRSLEYLNNWVKSWWTGRVDVGEEYVYFHWREIFPFHLSECRHSIIILWFAVNREISPLCSFVEIILYVVCVIITDCVMILVSNRECMTKGINYRLTSVVTVASVLVMSRQLKWNIWIVCHLQVELVSSLSLVHSFIT